MKNKMISLLLILYSGHAMAQTITTSHCNKIKTNQSVINHASNLCKIVTKREECKSVKKEDLISCDPNKKIKTMGAGALFSRCVSDFKNDIFKSFKFIKNYIKSNWKSMFSLKRYFSWGHKVKEKANSYMNSINNYIITEFKRAYRKYGSYTKAIQAMAEKFWDKIYNIFKKIIKSKINHYECLNQNAKNLMYCKVAMEAFSPPLAIFSLLKYGPKVINQFSNLKKAFSNLTEKKYGPTLKELLEKENKRKKTTKNRGNDKNKKKAPKIKLNQMVIFPTGKRGVIKGKVTAMGKSSAVITYLDKEGNYKIQAVSKRLLTKVSNYSNEAKKLKSITISSGAVNKRAITSTKKRITPKKRQEKSPERINSSEIWKKTEIAKPAIGKKIYIIMKDGTKKSAEVTAHGKTGFTSIYRNSKGNYRMHYTPFKKASKKK